MSAALRLALTTLTVLPVRGPTTLDRTVAGRAMALAPLVGVLLAVPAVLVLVLVEGYTQGPPLLAAVLPLGLLALLTRGLHLDGLADLADGLGTYGSPERARAVMKQPDVGAFGVAALVLLLAVQAAALLACTSAGRGGVSLGIAVVTGRLAITLACTPHTPAATDQGLGALVAGSVRTQVAVVVAVATVAVVLAVGALGAGALHTAAACLLGLGAAGLLARHAVTRLGGLTGDVLGALVEVCTATVLVVLALQV